MRPVASLPLLVTDANMLPTFCGTNDTLSGRCGGKKHQFDRVADASGHLTLECRSLCYAVFVAQGRVAQMIGSVPALSPLAGEFMDAALERSYRQSQCRSEIQQFRLVWLTTLLFFCAYGALDITLGQSGLFLLGLRALIVCLGLLTVVAFPAVSSVRARDALAFSALLSVSLLYALILRERADPANPAGALLLLVVGIYMFSPGRFWLVCANALFCSLFSVLGLVALPTAGSEAELAYSYLLPANVLAALALVRLNRARRWVFWQQRCLEQEYRVRRRAEHALRLQYRRNRALLYNALPVSVAKRLQARPGRVLARRHERATVIFADLVGFSELSRTLPPARLLEILNYLFCRFDEAAERHGLEKIKTLGDAYMAVAGVTRSPLGQAYRTVMLGLDQVDICMQASTHFGCRLQLRVGIHSGPLIAGVIGRQRYAFDVWGETVNVASRLQVAAQAGRILVSQPVRDACAENFLFGSCHRLSLRGCGEVQASNLYSLRRPAQPVLNGAGSGFC